MKAHTKKLKHQVSTSGVKAVRAGEWEQRCGGTICKRCSQKPAMQDKVFDKLPHEKLVDIDREARRQAADSAKEFKAALEAAMLKKRESRRITADSLESIRVNPITKKLVRVSVKPKRTYIRGARGRFAMKPETRETAAALADAVQARKSIMDRATEVRQSRNRTYGGPILEWTCQAAMLNAYLRRRFGHTPVVIQAHDIGAVNIIQKMSRHASGMAEGKYHADNMVDAAGFADCIDEVIAAREETANRALNALLKTLTE